MKNTTLKLLSLTLAVIMLIGAFAACKNKPQTEPTTQQTDAPQSEGETAPSTNETGTENGSGNNGTESGNGNGTETETEPGIEIEIPSVDEIKNSLLIQNANALMNGVNAYFTDGKRTDFALENQNMTLEYALAAYKDQQVTSLKNKEGKTYIENTCDVFVTMANGNTFYASNSQRAATANLYRFGYYMYESRFEEQVFSGAVTELNSSPVDISSWGEKSKVKISKNEDGSQHVIISDTNDPQAELKNVTYATTDYNYIKITMRASSTNMTSCAFYVWVEGKGSSPVYFSVLPDGEFHTYYVDLSGLSNYDGKVTKIRLDFESNVQKGDAYDITEISLVNGVDAGEPENLGLNRSFYTYSDKLHQVVQIATDKVATTDIALIGVETKIAQSTVDKLIVKDAKGTHTSLDGVDWNTAEYVGFDIKEAGIFGYIIPNDGRGDKLEVKVQDGYYVIIQSRTPENGTIEPSASWDGKKYIALEGCEDANSNANDFFMGHRLYTDDTHTFDKFLQEAENERNPLAAENFIISVNESSYEATYTCPECGFESDTNMLVCDVCYKEVTFITNENMYYIGYEPLRGIYQFFVPTEGFNAAYFNYPNKHINITFRITGDDVDRNIYVMSLGEIGNIECAALLDENKMLLPVPIEVGKNFSESSGERNLWNVEDFTYSEALFPMVIKAGSKDKYTLLNLYQNWGQYPLKQVSWIQFYAPYYHLSTGVTETNCIVPYYSCKNVRGLGTLPDHRAMSAPLWAGQPQHTSGGSHTWLVYTDANGVYSASENTLDYIDSYGPVYADVYMDYISDDGNIKVSYVHTEFPQTDENRAYYEMNYEVLGDVSFTDFARDFCFYNVGDNDKKGSYINVGYLNESNESVIVDAAKDDESFKYTLGDNSPYFSFFNMPDYNRESTSAEGYVNLSFLVYNYEFIINGQKSDAKFAIVNENDHVRISLDLGAVTLKKGDKFTINCIVMPWGSQESVYDSTEIAGDQNVRDVRVNTLLNPLTPVAVEHCEVMDSVFVPKIRTTNGLDATFTLKGGQNNVAVRVYGFKRLTAPKIQELVNGEWVDYQISSAYTPDRFGFGYYYDGYSVHYDAEDQTFSYAFIVPMDYTDADGRTFRIKAYEEFEEWPREMPEIDVEEVELPLNLYYTASELYSSMKNSIGKNAEKILLATDSSYTSIFANGSIEAYFEPFTGDGGKTVTGQYFVLKYRIPETNVNPYNNIEIWTSTKDNSKSGCSYDISTGFINDGKWHVLVVDLSAWNKETFQPNDDGEYKAMYLRIDIFNSSYAKGNSIDLAYAGMHDNVEDLFELNKDLNEILVVTEKNKLAAYDSKGNAIDVPDDSDPVYPTEGFEKIFPAADLAGKATGSAGGHSGKTTTSPDGSYMTIFHDTDETRQRTESYFTVMSGNTKVTGQYLVLRYRASKPCGYIEIYTSTEKDGAASGHNFYITADKYLLQTDNEWHNVVIDLSKVIPDYFKANSKGEYIAKYLRIDLFNLGKFTTDELYIDIAYIGFCTSYEDAISHAENSFFYDGSAAINATTGKPLDGSTPTPSTPSTTADYIQYFNATAITKSLTAAGSGHLGEKELLEGGSYSRIHLCTDSSKSEAVRRESYFYLLSKNTALTGQYLVIKYRAPEQLGSLQVYASTENASASDGGNSLGITQSKGLFLGDNEWHVIVIDLSKSLRTYTPTDGQYYAKHLRIDVFNFDSVPAAGTETYVDFAYIGTTDDYTKIIGKDTTVENLIVYDGTSTTTVPNVKQ